MNKTIAVSGTLAASAFLLAGCITHESNTSRDAERAKVEFENDAAARIFYEALSHGHCDEGQ